MSSHHPVSLGPGPSDLSDCLTDAAHWIWDRRRAAKAAGFPFSEETVTETVLLDLASALSHLVKIVPFNKHQEGKIGADWEWCFYDSPNQRFLRFMVQAKVLNDADEVYAHIDRYIGSSNVRQIDRLAETASARGVPAIYVFYNHLSDTSRVPVDACSCFKCLQCWGATFAPLEAVAALLPDKTFTNLRSVSLPWLCLTCSAFGGSGGGSSSGGGRGPDLIDTVVRGLERSEARCRDQLGDRIELTGRRPIISREPPDYLGPLLDRGDEEDGERLVEKLGSQNPGVDGVVLIPADLDMEERWVGDDEA